MGRIGPEGHFRVQPGTEKREREGRWGAPGLARVVHPAWGTVVVPCGSKLAALMNAAEIWCCDWIEIRDSGVWAAEPWDVPERMPDKENGE